MQSYSSKGLIFNIVQGSFVDGYGIRTTIFLKGCPLHCIWCCNPEGQSFQRELAVTYEKCNGCGGCLSACSDRALSLDNGIIQVDRIKCQLCGKCISACNYGVFSFFGTEYTVDEIFELIQRDKPFYDASGGGLTIGGGEATCWPDFVLALIARCKQAGIHTAIDTCGYITSERGMACLEAADLLLFDIKGLDPAQHKENTGRSNEVILNTLRYMNDIRKPIIVRIPYIPGYNDDPEMVRQEAELLSSLECIKRVDIIPKHEFGKVKYEQIGMEYTLDADDVPAEKQQELLELFSSYGLNTQIGG